MGGWAQGQKCADPGAMTPSGASWIFSIKFKFSKNKCCQLLYVICCIAKVWDKIELYHEEDPSHADFKSETMKTVCVIKFCLQFKFNWSKFWSQPTHHKHISRCPQALHIVRGNISSCFIFINIWLGTLNILSKQMTFEGVLPQQKCFPNTMEKSQTYLSHFLSLSKKTVLLMSKLKSYKVWSRTPFLWAEIK